MLEGLLIGAKAFTCFFILLSVLDILSKITKEFSNFWNYVLLITLLLGSGSFILRMKNTFSMASFGIGGKICAVISLIAAAWGAIIVYMTYEGKRK